MHSVPRTLVEQPEYSLDLPMTEGLAPKSCSKQAYESTMKKTLTRFKGKGVSYIIFGEVFLENIREHHEDNLPKVGMNEIFPIWGQGSQDRNY